MPTLKPLIFVPLDLDTFAGSERLIAGNRLGSALDAGIQAYLRAQYTEAIGYLRDVLRAMSPGSSAVVLSHREQAIVHLYLGNSSSYTEDWVTARFEYEQAVDADPDLPEAHYNLGVASAANYQPDQAIASFKNALDRDEGLYEAHFALGRTYQRLGDPLRAYVHYTSAHELRPEASEPIYYMGLMHQSQGAAELAQESFAQALQVDTTAIESGNGPQDLLTRSDAETAHWYYRLADDLKAQGYDDDAERIYRALLQWQPDEHRARYLLGNLLARMKRWEDAVGEYLIIPAFDPYYVVARLRIAAVLRLCKRLKQAYNILYECAKTRPYEGQTFVQMGKILYDLEYPTAAARALERATDLMQTDAFALYMLGFMYLLIGHEAWAIIAWRRSIRLQPQTYSLRYDLACIYMRREQHQRAIAELKEVLQHRPEDLGAAFLLALCYKESSEPARAIPLLERVVKRQPTHAQAIYHLGACYLQIGGSEVGRAYLKQYDRLLTGGARAPRLPHEALPKHVEGERLLHQAT